MSKLSVRYTYGHNQSGTGQHEVLEYVTESRPGPVCRCASSVPSHLHSSRLRTVEEGPYVALYTESEWAARAIAAILNADTLLALDPNRIVGGRTPREPDAIARLKGSSMDEGYKG